MSMITATTWVPRGHAAPFPNKYEFDEEEYNRIAEMAKLQLDDAKEDLAEAEEQNLEASEEQMDTEEKPKSKKKSKGDKSNGASEKDEDLDDDLKEYDLEHYDDDEEDREGDGDTMGMFGNIKKLVYHESNADDPYITLKDDPEDDEDREELQILATDNLVLAARIDDEVAHLEVYVYEDEADNLYVHHDIMLPAIPLAVEWLDVPVGKGASSVENAKGNYVAIGTMDPDIELWDLDTIDCMYPNAILGEGNSSNTKNSTTPKKKKKKSKKPNDTHHVDAVLSLAANRSHRNLLASSSADTTLKLWDLSTTTCAHSYTHHTDKVCTLAWNPNTPTVLLSGSYDRTVVASDMRAPTATPPRWGVESDVETVKWDPHAEHTFYVTTESGMVHYFDARVAPSTPAKSKPLWTLQAHEDAVASFDVNPVIPGFLATGSADKTVKLWNVHPETGPSMVVSRDVGVGKVFATSFAPDAEVGFRLAVAGSQGAVQIWDTSTNAGVRRAFASRVAPLKEGVEVKERMVGVAESDSDSESGSDEEDEGAQDGWESMDED
ncbi:WD40 repeat-like protein [Pseudovirgaria hyperparasitica]|uniref:WD40 repeat-like protein n=1 Tax=Pseudovirgaria hyperparasitica TaxID=470096 RepID=A0A6A6VVG8_9PEZI|nr:WD40 repeat-like protein [Pseudovirgaria hyperparasitica]KAF2754223.1 WD40 repeat-like protein [Pseudovirgaria hyperparasitica]